MDTAQMRLPNTDCDDAEGIALAPREGNSEIKLLLRPGDAAKALSISPRKLWAMTNSGEIPCVRFGRSVRYDPADLREWIDQQKGGRR
jgi:excisionase family DNA binding protein